MITFTDVTKTYPNHTTGVEKITLSIPDGDFVFLVGRTGSGKTTLLKLLTAEIPPTNGKITVFDLNLQTLTPKAMPYYRRLLGIIDHDFPLIDDRTVYQNLELAMLAAGSPGKTIRTSIPLALGLVGMGARMHDYPSALSGGELFRILMARAVINNPKIIIADEPTANLDYDTALDIMMLFQEINKLGITVIIATHAKEFVDLMHKRVITLQNGKLLGDVAHAKYRWIT